jgi:hypothetical protein
MLPEAKCSLEQNASQSKAVCGGKGRFGAKGTNRKKDGGHPVSTVDEA